MTAGGARPTGVELPGGHSEDRIKMSSSGWAEIRDRRHRLELLRLYRGAGLWASIAKTAWFPIRMK